jgi:dUTPase
MLCFNRTTDEARAPSRGSKGACGLDLPLPHAVTILPGKKVTIDLNLQVCLPEGHFGLLKLRSGAARRYALTLHAGVIGMRPKKSLRNSLETFLLSI